MDNSTKDQILNLIDKSQSILLLTHAKADCDGLGSMISMYMALQSLGKDVVAATNDPAPDSLSFLPSINIVQNSLASKNFIITLDITKTPLSKIKYKLADDQSHINIIVTPKDGHYKASDVTFNREAGEFDLIITFDTGNLEHLGPIYDQNSELFFNVPVINIDHHASNTDYGRVNYVDVVAASTTEVLLGLLEYMEEKYEKKFLNEDVATLLLAGLITDTGSFQHANTSPRAMEVAAKLLDLGARQQEIIKNIYKTKPLSTLKLWGVVLSKVETDPIYRMVWSSISKNDLDEVDASSEESEGIIDDLLSNAPGAEVIMLFKYNEAGYVSVSMRSTTNSVDVGRICTEMGGGGHVRAAGFKRRDGSSLEKMIDDTLKKVREYQGNRLNIHMPEIPESTNFEAPVQKKTFEPASEKKEDERPERKEAGQSQEPKKVQYLDFRAGESLKPLQDEPKKEQRNEQKEEKPSGEKSPSSQKQEDDGRKDNRGPKPEIKAQKKDFPARRDDSRPKKDSGNPQPSQNPKTETQKSGNKPDDGQMDNRQKGNGQPVLKKEEKRGPDSESNRQSGGQRVNENGNHNRGDSNSGQPMTEMNPEQNSQTINAAAPVNQTPMAPMPPNPVPQSIPATQIPSTTPVSAPTPPTGYPGGQIQAGQSVDQAPVNPMPANGNQSNQEWNGQQNSAPQAPSAYPQTQESGGTSGQNPSSNEIPPAPQG